MVLVVVSLEGFIDVAHFAWVHHNAFANRDNPVVPKYHTERTNYGLKTVYISNVSNYPHELKHLELEGFLWKRTFEVYPPFFCRAYCRFSRKWDLKNFKCLLSYLK